MSSVIPSSPSKSMAEAPVTISAVLNALHEHLQTQTQLLPTLHAQLGLPPSALTDELSALQQKLAETVEKQIEGRREEVENWMKKCDDIERDCLRGNKALGASSKSIGASVGELRKQQVLPVRYEMLNQYQVKLNQLYHTKLEQLANLANRFSSLTRVLGPDFFPPDITEIPAAQGENAMDAMALRDVAPERFLKMEKELSRGKAEINRRLVHLATTFHQMDWLYDELDIQPPSCEDPSTTSTSSSLQASTTSTPSDDPFLSSSISTPTPASRAPTRRNLTDLKPTAQSPNIEYARIFALFTMRISEAEEAGNTVEPGSLVGVEGVEPSVGLIRWAEQTKAELEDIKRRRETHIQTMYDQLENLWKRLGVPEEAMDGFVENNRGSSEEVVQAYEQELERMLELKRESMGVFIANARAEIEKLWDELMVGEEERSDFTYFTEEDHSEELLTIHEEEIRKLKEERKLKASLLASIKKYFEICEEQKELAAASMDQTRLLGRGPRDPGRLLREEKMRKRVQREKPKLEQDLLRTIPAWEEEHGKQFLVHGTSIVETLMETANATADKENSRRKPGPGGRAGSVPPRSITPGANGLAGSSSNPNARHTRSVSASGGSVTPAVRPASAMSNSSSTSGSMGMQGGPNKRQRTVSQSAMKTRADTQQPASSSRRAPLGLSTSTSRRQNQTQGYDGSSDTEWGVRSSVRKGGKTPSTSLPSRTRAAASSMGGKAYGTLGRSTVITATNSISKSGTRGGGGYAGLGIGHMSAQPQRTVSGPAHASTYSTLRPSSRQTQSQSHSLHSHSQEALSQIALAAKRGARAVRRESFRPRPSMDMDGPALLGVSMSSSRYAGFSGSPVREEED